MQRVTSLTAFLLIISFPFLRAHLFEKDAWQQTFLLSFEAKKKMGNTVLLRWSTSAENGVSHFVVQRSIDENNFDDEAIIFTDQMNKASKRKYKYPDKVDAVMSNILYYRLKIVSLNGELSYSQVKKIKLKNR